MRSHSSHSSAGANRLTILLLSIYLVILCWILLFKLGVQFSYMNERRVNFIPFIAFFNPGQKADLAEIGLNVLIFLPLGIYLNSLCAKWSGWTQMSAFLGVSFLFELIQFTGSIGAFDVTDIITNVIGGVLGWLVFKAIEQLYRSRIRAQHFVNIAGVCATVLIIAFLLLLKLGLLPVKYQ